jgi:UPF0716 protein FxsA
MGWFLVVAFLVVPVVEIYVIVQVGQQIGALPTVLLLIFESALGAWIVRREGSRAWRALQTAATSGQLPSRELADAGLVLIGGTLLLTPGFVTDVVGFFFVLPPTRPLARRLLLGFVARRATVAVTRFGPTGPGGGPAYGPGRGSGRVVPGEVVRDEPVDRSPGGPDEEPPDDRSPGRATGG